MRSDPQQHIDIKDTTQQLPAPWSKTMPPPIVEPQFHDQTLREEIETSVRNEKSETTPENVLGPVVHSEPAPQLDQTETTKDEPEVAAKLVRKLSEEDGNERMQKAKFDDLHEGLNDHTNRRKKKGSSEAERYFRREKHDDPGDGLSDDEKRHRKKAPVEADRHSREEEYEDSDQFIRDEERRRRKNASIKAERQAREEKNEVLDEVLSDDEKRQRKKASIEAERHFTRKNGIIYVSDEYWLSSRWSAVNCHLFVSSTLVADKPTLKGTERPMSKGDRVHSPDRWSRSASQSLDEPTIDVVEDKGLAKATSTHFLPFRVRIMNELLREEMRRVCGLRWLNQDHAAPFRSIVTFEKEFKHLLKQKEDEFLDIARQFPDHPAVRRKEQFVPTEVAYGLRVVESTSSKDRIDRARILLDGLRALVYFLDTDLRDLVETVQLLKSGRVDELPFSYLWYLFTPGQEIITRHPKPQVYRVLQVTGGRKSLSARGAPDIPRSRKAASHVHSRITVSNLLIDCFYLDFDGTQFGAKPFTISIRPYEDLMPVTNLVAYPLIYDNEICDTDLINRGKKFSELVRVSHRRYKGISLREGEIFDRFEEIDSDVMIDFELAFRNSEPKIRMPNFGGGEILAPTIEDPEETHDDGGVSYDDHELMTARWSHFVHSTDLLRPHPQGTLTEDGYRLLPARVYGYVLLSRKWYPLDVDLVKDVPKISDGDKDGFERLILPHGHKEIVRALVQTHARRATTDDGIPVNKSQREFDVVKGKGKGLIILLHGAPGVGKSSTAECVAANAGKPLFPITCGDLGGNTAQEVERNLEKFFDLARKWNCVLLLDEADVFLSAREKGDIRQNSLVSVFLRVLEYYSGILILTTNRVGSFDEAIKSRVHCALYYPPLDMDQTLDIWNMHLDLLNTQNKSSDMTLRVRFDDKEIIKYARRHWKKGKDGNRWNGRQIKNAFQTAIALADWDNLKCTGGCGHPDGPLLERKHFEMVAKASDHFDMYLEKVRRSDHIRAAESELRNDKFRVDAVTNEPYEKTTRKHKSAKRRTKSRAKPKAPETSEGSSSEESHSEQASSTSTSESESDDAEPEESSPPEPPKKKKSSKKSSRKE